MQKNSIDSYAKIVFIWCIFICCNLFAEDRQLSIDDIDLDGIELTESILKEQESNLIWDAKLRILYKGAKFAIAEHVKKNQTIYIIGAACGVTVIAGGLVWHIVKNNQKIS